MLDASFIFNHKNLTSDFVAYYQLDSISINAPDTLVYDLSSNANNGFVKMVHLSLQGI